jgi:hypothetical protein
MARLLAFVVGILLLLALVATSNFRVDPFGEFYDDGMLSAALGQSPACVISNDLISGFESQLDFKLALVRRLRAETLVFGSSRVQTMHSWPGEQTFVNFGMPSTGAATLVPLFRRLRKADRRPLRVYIGVDFFWFTSAYPVSTYRFALLGRVHYLFSRTAIVEAVKMIGGHPTSFLQRWRRHSIPAGCEIDRASPHRSPLQTTAFRTDGTVVFPWELGQPAVNPIASTVTEDVFARFPFLYANWHDFSTSALSALDQALRLARSYGWTVVGYATPYIHAYAHTLSHDPRTSNYWKRFRSEIPAVFHRQRFAFLDVSDATVIPCGPREWEIDPVHANGPCAMRIRTKLDALAALAQRR